ncbi:acetolactate synthase large subunit [Pelagicoccus sp. SDUM812005]|uniref:acetolactate synthase large subunit n=1 Tax=Pelagicoccus sp. SDUM812005 TaxID=3041257 RepID=UPI00280CB1C2|nr:acetolactate synthase large subunit [Pelagicoccus sp. SDUM812005]MDQ8179078.1 acetolactate synthase large subunit [Pelagicoccus sp. SDUM812005]
MNYTGAEILIKLLERQGIQRIAGIPGGANLPMYDALSRSETIRHVLARHEQGAGFIAHGQARVTGESAVFFATSGPGATNTITALADAKLDSIPVICITGQVPKSLIGTDAFQEIDTFGLSLPVTKHSYFAQSAEELLQIIPEAFRVANSGRPGPVLIDIPKDVQMERIQVEQWPEPGRRELESSIEAKAIEAAARMIDEAQRPVIYLGGGAIHSGASSRMIEFAERIHAPVTTTLMGLGAFPASHPQSIGMLGMHAARYTNKALEECDLLIALGARFDDRATGKVAQFCPDAKIVHIDIDAAELHKIKTAHIAIQADLNAALQDLIPATRERRREAWMERIAELKRDFPMEMPDADSPTSAYGIIRQTQRICPEDTIVTTDVGQHQMRAAQAFSFDQPRRWLTSGGLGTMGFGLPAAIGAALEAPEQTIVCFSGDGSLMMNIQELATAAEEGANLKVVLCNNNSLGLVHQQQTLFYGKNIFASNFSSHLDFCMIARGFGVGAYDLGKTEDPQAALEEALKAKGTVLINVPIDVTHKVFPMVPPGGANSEALVEQAEREVAI